MSLSRRLYQADRGGPSFVPLDAHWGMLGEFATAEVRECMALSSAYMTAEETSRLLKKSSLFHPSTKAVYSVLQESGSFVEENLETIQNTVAQQSSLPEKTEALVASMDGVNVLLREPGVKKGRPTQRPGEPYKPPVSSYKNAMVGSFSFYNSQLDEKKRLQPSRLKSQYIARMPEDSFPTFKAMFNRELDSIESQLAEGVIKILLNDGHLAIWGFLEDERYDDYEKLIDFYHTSEHLSLAAEALFGKSSPKAQKWYDKFYHRLQEMETAPKQVIRSMQYYRKKNKLSSRRLEKLDKQITFFERNQKYMTYASFLKRGLPIGSGPVEAACKTVVKTRMGRSGMRWNRQSGQHVLNLPTYALSDQWDEFWDTKIKLKNAA